MATVSHLLPAGVGVPHPTEVSSVDHDIRAFDATLMSFQRFPLGASLGMRSAGIGWNRLESAGIGWDRLKSAEIETKSAAIQLAEFRSRSSEFILTVEIIIQLKLEDSAER